MGSNTLQSGFQRFASAAIHARLTLGVHYPGSNAMPDTLYADCDGLSIAYQVMGDGPIDVILVPGIFSHVEQYHEFPQYTDFLRQLSTFSRVIAFDKRGQGLSDRIEGVATFEQRTDDLLAVMEATRSERAAVFGLSEGAAMALLFAASHPQKVSHVITFGGYAKSCSAPDYPYMPSKEDRRAKIGRWIEDWGKGDTLDIFVPALADSDAAKRLFGKLQRASCAPSAMRKYFDMNLSIDVREMLPLVQAPTLVMHHRDDRQVPFACSEDLRSRLPNAKLVDCGEGGHYFWGANNDRVVSEIRQFLVGDTFASYSTERVLATVLFLDIVNSSQKLNDMGDAAWQEIMERHDNEAADLIELYRGSFIKSTGDGLLATFDGPGRAVQCACALVRRLAQLGIEARAGLHTGEIELRGEDISGSAVHVAARIEENSSAGEVLVSRTVVDLTIGNSFIECEPRGEFSLKGIPGRWPLYKATI